MTKPLTPPRFIALPPRGVTATRLAWRISRAIVARGHGWSLEQLSVSRRWQFQVGRSRRMVQAHVSFWFSGSEPRGPGAVFQINFEGKGSESESVRSALMREVAGRLGRYGSRDGKSLLRRISETKPRLLLAEMDRIGQAFGANDRHSAPPSRSQALGKRLTVIAEAVLAHGTWSLESQTMRLRHGVAVMASITPLPHSARTRSALGTMLYISDRNAPEAVAAITSAESRSYDERAGEGQPDAALMKSQPLSLRAALTEARFLEAEIATLRV